MTQSRPKGNILSVTFDGNTTTYTYDPWNQLIREDNQAGGYTYVWTYDNAGNILYRTRYDYTTGTLGSILFLDKNSLKTMLFHGFIYNFSPRKSKTTGTMWMPSWTVLTPARL